MVLPINRVDFVTDVLAADINGIALAVNGIGIIAPPPTGVAATDTANLQAVFDAAPVTGGRIWLPGGVYKINATLQIKNHNITVMGIGAGLDADGYHSDAVGTRLEASGTLSGGAMLLVQSVANTNPLHGVRLMDFALDGMNTATGDGLHYRSYRGMVRDLKIYRFASGKGFHPDGYNEIRDSPNVKWDLYETQVNGVEVSECAHGFYWDLNATDLHVSHCVLFNNTTGWELFGGGSVQADGCHLYDNTQDNLWFNGSGSRSKFTGFKIEGAGRYGVNIDSTNGGYADLQFIGCNLSSNCDELPTNTNDAFIIQGTPGVTRTKVTGCNFTTKDLQVDNLTQPRYYIYLNTSAQDTLIHGCSFDDKAITAPVGGSFTALKNTEITACVGSNIDTGWRSGSTASRPVDPVVGYVYYDTTVGGPIVHDGANVWRELVDVGAPGGDGGTAFAKTVAASDSSTIDKSRADYTCTGVNDEVEINAAITAVGAGEVILSAGTFELDGSIELKASVTLKGQGVAYVANPSLGAAATKLSYNPASGAAIQTTGTSEAFRYANIGLFGFSLSGPNTSTGIFLDSVSGAAIENVTISDLKIGLHARSLWDSTVKGCRFDSCGDATGTEANPATLFEASPIGTNEHGGDTNTTRVTDCIWESNRGPDLILWPGSGTGKPNKNYFIGCKFERIQALNTDRVIIEDNDTIGFTNCTVFTAATAGAGLINAMRIVDSIDVQFRGMRLESQGAVQTLETWFSLTGNNGVVFEGLMCQSGAVDNPNSIIKYTGTNNNVKLGSTAVVWAGGSPFTSPTEDGSATSYIAQQTGVGVDAASIHAALVALGLFTA